MRLKLNPGRVAGSVVPTALLHWAAATIYIPNKLFVDGDAAATVRNILAHEWLFRFGIVSALAGGVLRVFLILALYRVFVGVDRNLAVQVVIFGGVMPATLFFVNAMFDTAWRPGI